ncbi:CoA transferase [Rhodococcus sp. ACS1]|uniref:CaiB/BaiF CoA-transferase family protein n=1 Tax=Rhodococcus sp. ACS1 TaxID=2028570 RepID=UPI000BB15421|nr:CoA transferase [Rhodococcus sp. ACS1]PBC47987.1 CoA transferase [Rhodococcus sp. ACS1]
MTDSTDSTRPAPLAGLVVVDLSTTLAGAQATQFLADSGADVILVEAPEGSPLRQEPGWPGLLRSRRSISLDLDADADLDVLDGLLTRADVLVTTMRPAELERRGFTAESLSARYPRLVAATITGWGTQGPWSNYKSYEALVMAKCGIFHSKRQLAPGPDPTYVSVPYASFGAAHSAVQGILAALIEREQSGLGQVVESNLVTGVGAYDPYNWFYEMILHRYPDAFESQVAAFDDQGRPQSRLMFALLVATTKDGTWLQFSQSAPRLLQAWVEELGMAEELTDPKWAGFPVLPDADLRFEWWNKMISKVGERTLAEWESTFERNPNVAAEQFRSPDEALDHPQLVHERRVVTVDDPNLGPVRQPSTLVHAGGNPLTDVRPAPRIGEHSDELRAFASSAPPETTPVDGNADGVKKYPLEGVTVLELGAMYAGPYGATLLTDLGARVIKIEPLGGDLIRGIMAYPEAGGAKVLQGKESIAIDLGTEEGRDVLHRLVKQCDAVLQCFRAGASRRIGFDEASLRKINPDLVYLNAVGYGVDGPYASRPAYAPSMGAASGVSVTDSPLVRQGPEDREELLTGARSLYAGGTVPAVQADGVAALGAGSALLLGIYAKRRGIVLADLVTTMLASCTQILISRNTSYAGRQAVTRVDDEFRGLGPLYRMYRAADGWVFLAAPEPDEWAPLVRALSEYDEIRDERFADPESRRVNSAALVAALSSIFGTRKKDQWESLLTAQDVGCVAVAQETAEWCMQTDEFHNAGYTATAVSPVFDEHRRLAPLNSFSRSDVKADAGCTLGEHTDALLSEIGYGAAQIAELRDKSIAG